ncbi:MAG: dTDP-4-dehydrorhamnose reductase [Pseudomonadota bacterium]
MTLLVFGQSGQVARELAIEAPQAVFLDRTTVDLSQPETCAEAILTHKPSAVINAAAYTAVDQAEQEEEIATRVNGAAPGKMAQACAELTIPFVQISTDYVFSGSGTTPWHPAAETGPINAYGRSKLAGEEATRAAGGPHAILRTSWVFSAYGNNFLKTMLRVSESRDKLSVVADQTGGPTPAKAIARACLQIADALKGTPEHTGTYHFSGSPDVSWAGFAREIFQAAKRTVLVADIPTSAYPTPAIRPANSRLDCMSLSETFGIARPDWKDAVADIVKELA